MSATNLAEMDGTQESNDTFPRDHAMMATSPLVREYMNEEFQACVLGC